MQSSLPSNTDKLIGFWLFSVAAMIFVMVVLGGLTRLTGSGLSMVDWKPVTGWLPPLSIDQWQSVFELYKQSPQYEKTNYGMSLDEFQGIFWLEFLHRLLGRVIGLAFGLPLAFFLVKGWVRKDMILPLCGLFILGGAQGVLGWYMVKSGLVDIPEVSQYRLMAHLGFAFILYAALIWTGLSFYKRKTFKTISLNKMRSPSLALLCLSYITILAGSLVAGLDAGLTYNSFPLMDGELVPSGLHSLNPWYFNHFENITTVQFQHRLLAIVTFIMTFLLFFKFRNQGLLSLKLSTLIITFQVIIGIATLIYVVPVGLASLHQAFGLLVFTAFTWLNYEVRN